MLTAARKRLASKDKAICEILLTNPSELERILKKSRQTIAKHMEDGKLFGIEEVIDVANIKLQDDAERARTVRMIIGNFFPDILTSVRDTNVERFSSYCIYGMYIQAEILANAHFEQFVRGILSDQSKKFVLFVCRPQKEHLQLTRWLEAFRAEVNQQTASFAVLPCKLLELSPIQIIAEPWSEQPKLIQIGKNGLFVDEESTRRAAQLVGTLMDYGLSESACDRIEERYEELKENLNSSFYDETSNVKPFVVLSEALRRS